VRHALQQGLIGLRDHRLRTVLTALGVVFGVAAVIAMLSISEGARREALAQFESLGADNVIVMHQDPPSSHDGEESGRRSLGLARSDAAALDRLTPAIAAVVPLSVTERDVVGRERLKTTVVGTSAELPRVRHDRLLAGRFFTAQEDSQLVRVCVVGAGLVRELFGVDEPVGSFLKIDEHWYEVIGVLSGSGAAADDQDGLLRATERDIYIPLSCALLRGDRKVWDRELDRLIVHVADLDQLEPVAELAGRVLARRHHDEPDTRVVVPLELIRKRQATQRIFSLIMGAIAGISLLVGGIGIMNIMLASVLERTREIGVRLACGATGRDIMTQFLVEAAAVSFAGGLVGVVLGVSLAWTIAAAAGWTTVVSAWSIVLAFGVSAAVGITFGYVPARKAAALDPIECLRYE
jgi:putative ABC transport system permease protein